MFTGIMVGTQSEKRGEAYVVQVPAYEMVLTTYIKVRSKTLKITRTLTGQIRLIW